MLMCQHPNSSSILKLVLWQNALDWDTLQLPVAITLFSTYNINLTYCPAELKH